MSRIRIHVVEFGASGHRGEYIQHLAAGWCARPASSGTLRITVSPDFADLHADIFSWIVNHAAGGLLLDVLPAAAANQLRRAKPVDRVPSSWIFGSGPPEDSVAALQWDVAQDLLQQAPADHLLMMELDTILPALAAHRPSISPVSGLWFKPAFHDVPGGKATPLWARHQQVLLVRMLSHPHLRRIFCLDPEVPNFIGSSAGRAKLRYVADPVTIPASLDQASREQMRRHLGIPPDRIVLLFFGQLARRKGLIETFAAVGMLSSGHRARLTLIVAGAYSDIDPGTISEALYQLERAGVHVLLREGFLAESEIDTLLAISDAVLAPYRQHVGMSGVLLRAAAHARPVLSQDYGLMGRLVRSHRLGLVVDTLDVRSLADGLAILLEDAVGDRFDPMEALAFARSHDPALLHGVLFRELLGLDETK